ncbi:MAG: RagB/SusD family nutrient uptake outer membrane protein [Marinilabiliaceae bacterium]
MKTRYIAVAALVAGMSLSACVDELDVTNPNTQTTEDFGKDEASLQEAIIACYNRIRLEGTFARVGYTMDAVRADEVYSTSQIWYLPYDALNVATTDEIGNQWIWRDCYHVVNRTNFVLQQVENVALSQDAYNKIKGQALFLRSLAYYTLANYYHECCLITSYSSYSDINTMYASLNTYDEVLDQVEADLKEAMAILPSRNVGGDFAKGRATCGSAAGYYARTLMLRHKYSDAYTVLKDIIAGNYGTYALTADYGDNFREGQAYENNSESLFEVQFMDYGTGGVDEEWTPTNISKEATQGNAIEGNYGPAGFGSWGDLGASPWLYNLYKAERCTDGRLDPRLYWTLCSYESEYDSYTGNTTAAYPDGDPRANVLYQTPITDESVCRSNSENGGLAIAKWTYARQSVISTISVGLFSGINLRLMRYSDVLLRAAECENELNGPTQTAIDYINQVRRRVALPDLKTEDFTSADALFEQIANVERPKEFGCENGRGIDLNRWGFYYSDSRKEQLKQHMAYKLSKDVNDAKLDIKLEDIGNNSITSSMLTYAKGREYFPLAQSLLDANPHLSGNCSYKGIQPEFPYTVHPVVELSK